jgi:aminoglycoside phosphotransferase (APT) family kinase protein
VPVAEIYAYDDTHALIDRAYMLMERLPGCALSDVPHVSQRLYDGVLEQVGDALRQMHALTARTYGYIGAHHPMEPEHTWWAAFRAMWNALLDDVQHAGGYSKEETDLMRRLLDAYRDRFSRPVQASLLHMDVWSQNILIDEQGKVTGLVDLDRALWGDPENQRSGGDTARRETSRWRRRSGSGSTCSTRCKSTSSSTSGGGMTR